MSALPLQAVERDCWNRIGIQGNGTCELLQAHVHCRNCQVFADAARTVLDDRSAQDELDHWTRHFAQPQREQQRFAQSVLILRCSTQWLALPTAMCLEVAHRRPVHSLPHRRHAAVLGIVNVRGELVVCVSLAVLIGAARSDDSTARRLVVVNGDGAPVALEVDDVHGTHRFDPQHLTPLPDTLAAATARLTCATLRWRDRSVGVLERTSLAAGVARSLA